MQLKVAPTHHPLTSTGFPDSWSTQQDDFGQLVLHRAAGLFYLAYGNMPELGNLEVVKFLVGSLSTQVDLSKIWYQAKFLICTHSSDESGGTLLHYACLGENGDLVKFLLSACPELEFAGDSSGMTSNISELTTREFASAPSSQGRLCGLSFSSEGIGKPRKS